MGNVQGGVSDYRDLADVIADPTWAFDLDTGDLVFLAGCTREISGHSCDEIMSAFARGEIPELRRHFSRLMPRRIAAFRRGIAATFTDEVRVPRKDGGHVRVSVRSRIVHHAATGHLVVCGTARAVTSSPRTLEGSSQLALFEEMEQIARVGAWSFETATGKGTWTKEVARIHDLPKEIEPSAAMGLDFYPPHARAIVEGALERLLTHGTPYDLEVELTSARGVAKWVRTIARPVVEDGKVVAVRGTFQDITDRKTIEIELAAQRARLRTLLDTIPDIVFVKDLAGHFFECNRKFERLLGKPQSEIIGKTDHDFLPEEIANFFRERDRIAIERGESTKNEETLLYADGHREIVEMSKTPVRDMDGRIIGILGVGRDVTAAREATEALRASEEQLRAAQRMEAIGRLAGGVAHDFNNLLTVIMTCAIVVLDSLGEDAGETREDVEQIVAAGQRAEALTRQLLAFSRRQVLQPASLHLHTVVDQLAVMLRRLIGEDIDLRLRTTKVAPTMVDRGQIEQVVMNLVVNARDAMPKGGVVTIATKDVLLGETRARSLELASGWYVEVSVQDAGIGMDSATMARVFEPFFSTKEPGKGTGLGLSMVYGIVKQSGGGIAVESRPGHGARFSVYLPRDPACGASASDSPPAPSSRHPGAKSGHETILVVEDDESVRAVVRRILKNAGYNVLLAADGIEALAIAEEKSRAIALVLSDVVMPRMSGSALAEHLTTAHPAMKVMFTSGYTDDKIAREGVRGHRFLAKPFRPEQLTAAVREVLDDVYAPDID